MTQDYRSIAPQWRYFSREELLAQKEPNFYSRIGRKNAFWFGIFGMAAVMIGIRDRDVVQVAVFTAMCSISLYIAFTSMKKIVDGTICRIMVDGVDFGYRIDTGELEQFLHHRFGGRKIEVERTSDSVRTLALEYSEREMRSGPRSGSF